MLKKFQAHLNLHFPYLKDMKLLLAVSGGIDSMVLWHLMKQLHYNVSIAHCNFMLREKESNEDENFVKAQSNSNQTSGFFIRFDTKSYSKKHKLSIQLAARKLRYDWFNQLLITNKLDHLLTAHHLDDQIETFLINLTRGTGLDGLTGIPSKNDTIIRPLLPFSREEIKQYADEHQIQWREDSSNTSTKYLRNKLRHIVVPVFKELNPSFLTSFLQTLENLNQSQSLVVDASNELYKSIVVESENHLKINIPNLIKHSNYHSYLYQWLYKFGFTAWNDIYKLVTAPSGKQVYSELYMVLKDRDYLIVAKKHTDTAAYFIEENTSQVNIPLKMSLSRASIISNLNSNCIFVDADKILFPLVIRKWKTADVFYPSGMSGKKKVSKYFKDLKFSLIDKQNQWLLCSENQIIWIINQRADRRYIANNDTKNILKIATL